MMAAMASSTVRAAFPAVLLLASTTLVVAGLPSLAYAGEGADEGHDAADAAPPKGKKGKKKKAEPAPESEPESEAEAEVPEPEPAPEPEPEPEDDVAVNVSTTEVGAAAVTGSGMKGRVGVGAMRTLGGANGIRIDGYVTDKLTIGGVAGFGLFGHKAPNPQDGEFTETEVYGLFAGGLHAMYYPVQGNRAQPVHADFGIGGRAVVFAGLRPKPEMDDGTRDTPLELNVEMPVAMPIWFGENVVVIPEFGWVFRWVPGTREPDGDGNADENPGSGAAERFGTTNGPGLGFEIGDHGGLFFGLSIQYFFNRKSKK